MGLMDKQADSKYCEPSPSICEPSLPFMSSVTPVRETPTFGSLPLLSDVLPFVLQSCRDARLIPAVPPPLWKAAVLSSWELELSRLGVMIDNALTHPTDINLFNTLFALLNAPGTTLAPLLKVTRKLFASLLQIVL